jgi:hypothetical protein
LPSNIFVIKSLLGNRYVDTSLSPTAREKAVMEEALLCNPCSDHITRTIVQLLVTCVEADSSTSTVALQVIRGGGKGTQCPGPPCFWGYKYGDLALQFGGVSEIGKIKYGLESRGTQTREGLDHEANQ